MAYGNDITFAASHMKILKTLKCVNYWC